MHIIRHIQEIRQGVTKWRAEGRRVALVPTMGNLHAGHLALVERARQLADRTVATIFVNPLQFVAGEDYDRYPRTLEADADALAEAGVDLLFAPQANEVYHDDGAPTQVSVPALDGFLCGASRPGHFTGVATVVTKLFNIVQADVAVFGEKDYQQLLVIRRLVRDLCIPIDIVAAPTVREADGLALSSRNAYLDEAQRALAPALYRALQQAAARLRAGETDFGGVERDAMRTLRDAGLAPEYFSIRRAMDLAAPDGGDVELVILAAARLGETRLIDNVAVQYPH